MVSALTLPVVRTVMTSLLSHFPRHQGRYSAACQSPLHEEAAEAPDHSQKATQHKVRDIDEEDFAAMARVKIMRCAPSEISAPTPRWADR